MQIYKTSKARENILSKIRKELSGAPLPIPFAEVEKNHDPIYTPSKIPMEELFAKVFTELGGKFVYCDNEQELLENINTIYENYGWKKLLKLFRNNKMDIVIPAYPLIEDADACITDCEMLVARTGSILFSSKLALGRTASVFYPIHLVFAFANQIVMDIDEGIAAIKKKYTDDMPSMISLTTGPSRTADIEKTLVVGVHGPAEIFCFFINAEI